MGRKKGIIYHHLNWDCFDLVALMFPAHVGKYSYMCYPFNKMWKSVSLKLPIWNKANSIKLYASVHVTVVDCEAQLLSGAKIILQVGMHCLILKFWVKMQCRIKSEKLNGMCFHCRCAPYFIYSHFSYFSFSWLIPTHIYVYSIYIHHRT